MIYITTIGRSNILILPNTPEIMPIRRVSTVIIPPTGTWLREVHANFAMPVLMFLTTNPTMSLSVNISLMLHLILLWLLLLYQAIPNLPSLPHIRLAKTRIPPTV